MMEPVIFHQHFSPQLIAPFNIMFFFFLSKEGMYFGKQYRTSCFGLVYTCLSFRLLAKSAESDQNKLRKQKQKQDLLFYLKRKE